MCPKGVVATFTRLMWGVEDFMEVVMARPLRLK